MKRGRGERGRGAEKGEGNGEGEERGEKDGWRYIPLEKCDP